MSSALQSGTVQRVFGAILFIPVVAAFFISQSAAQWIFLALALIMVWEFCVMHQMTRAVRIVLVADVVLSRCRPRSSITLKHWRAGHYFQQ